VIAKRVRAHRRVPNVQFPPNPVQAGSNSIPDGYSVERIDVTRVVKLKPVGRKRVPRMILLREPADHQQGLSPIDAQIYRAPTRSAPSDTVCNRAGQDYVVLRHDVIAVLW
jgi:hypothetical protein